jgi:hypothetical protein
VAAQTTTIRTAAQNEKGCPAARADHFVNLLKSEFRRMAGGSPVSNQFRTVRL